MTRNHVLLIVLAAAGCAVDEDNATADLTTTSPWVFTPSRMTGGGGTMQVAVNPAQDDDVAVGGDTWGVWRSATAGTAWAGAMEPTNGAAYTGLHGTYSVYGLAYSAVDPNVLYALTGRYDEGASTDGSLLRIEGTQITVNSNFGNHITAADPNGPGSRHDHPRANNRLVVTSAGGHDHLFVASGSAQGIWHSSNDATSFTLLTPLGNDSVYTGSAILGDVLVVTTRDGRVVRCTHATSSTAACTVAHPTHLTTNFEDVKVIGGRFYAAARSSGVWRSTDGQTWTQWGNLPASVDWVVVGGSASHVYVGCVASSGDTTTCLQSANGNDATPTWTPRMATSALDLHVLGSGESWWYAIAARGGTPDGSGYYVADIEASADGTSVYVAGRGGLWKSSDAGATWHPATNGMQGWIGNPNPDNDPAGQMTGSQSFGFNAAHGVITVADYDFGCETTTLAQHFVTGVTHLGYGDPGCTAAALNVTPSLTAKCENGEEIRVIAPTAAGAPAQFLVTAPSSTHAVDQSTPYFRATMVKPEAIMCKQNWVYISSSGGGLMTAHVP